MKSVEAVAAAKKKKGEKIDALNPALAKIAHTKASEEIDNLFGDLKKNKNETKSVIAIEKSTKKRKELTDDLNMDGISTTKVTKARKETEEGNQPHGVIKSNNPRIIISPEAPVERVDPESGYKVYKAHILKVGEGGGTDLCPFDCDCCF